MAEFRLLETELTEFRAAEQNAEGTVFATVNGHGELIKLDVAGDLLYAPHPQFIGGQIIEAIQRARDVAAGEARTRMCALLGGEDAHDSFKRTIEEFMNTIDSSRRGRRACQRSFR